MISEIIMLLLSLDTRKNYASPTGRVKFGLRFNSIASENMLKLLKCELGSVSVRVVLDLFIVKKTKGNVFERQTLVICISAMFSA